MFEGRESGRGGEPGATGTHVLRLLLCSWLAGSALSGSVLAVAPGLARNVPIAQLESVGVKCRAGQLLVCGVARGEAGRRFGLQVSLQSSAAWKDRAGALLELLPSGSSLSVVTAPAGKSFSGTFGIPAGLEGTVVLRVRLMDASAGRSRETTAMALVDTEPPRSSGGCRLVTAGLDSLLLEWDPASDADFATYRLVYSFHDLSQPSPVLTTRTLDAASEPSLASPVTTSWRLGGLASGLEYTVRVEAADRSGQSTAYAPLVVRSLPARVKAKATRAYFRAGANPYAVRRWNEAEVEIESTESETLTGTARVFALNPEPQLAETTVTTTMPLGAPVADHVARYNRQFVSWGFDPLVPLEVVEQGSPAKEETSWLREIPVRVVPGTNLFWWDGRDRQGQFVRGGDYALLIDLTRSGGSPVYLPAVRVGVRY